jgi:hypothetical protein
MVQSLRQIQGEYVRRTGFFQGINEEQLFKTATVWAVEGSLGEAMDLSRWETGETMADRVAVHQHEACRRSTSKDRLTASSRGFKV